MAILAHPAAITDCNGIVRIAIADSQALFREALKQLLQAEPDFEVIAEAEDGLELVMIAREARPDVVLLDLGLPRCTGFDALREMRNAALPTLALLLVDSIDDQQLVQALCLGARGVAFKSSPPNLLMKSVRVVMTGEYWLERNRFSALIRSLNRGFRSPGKGNHQDAPSLNERERELVAAIAEGETTRDMAKKLCLSEITVRHHFTNIFRKLRVRNRGELLNFAISRKLGRHGNGLRQRSAVVQSEVMAA